MAAAQMIPEPESDGVTSEILAITPEMAEKCLAKNLHNRRVKPRVVESYAAQMTRGEWLLTGEAIKFSATGRLLDGQHRLMAIFESGKTVRMLVLYGLSDEVQDVLDTGSGRSAADQVFIHGYENSSLAAAAAKVAVLYRTGRFYVDSKKKNVSHREILDFLDGNSMMVFACSRAAAIGRACDLRPAVVAMCFYELMQVDDQDAVEFFDRLADGANLAPRHPILALRSRLQHLRRERSMLPPEILVSLVFRTWNAFRAQRTLTSLPIYQAGEFITCPDPK